MAFALRDLGVESIPVNFLNPIDGTPLAGTQRTQSALLPEGAGHVPLRESRRARSASPAAASCTSAACNRWASTPANSIFVGDYLTTKGQAPDADYKMIEDLGFEIAKNEEPGCTLEAETAGELGCTK